MTRVGMMRTGITVWTVRRAPGRSAHRGLLNTGRAVFACALGRAGISVFKREGDGATPAGDLAVLGGYFRRDRQATAREFADLAPIGRKDGWCDDPRHPAYNRPVGLPFAAGHERMWRDDRLYDVCLVLDWNVSRRSRHRGSAIFLHLQGEDRGPTRGCIAVAPEVMRRLLERIDGRTVIRVLA